MNRKKSGSRLPAIFFGVIVTLSLLYMAREISLDDISLDFSQSLSHRKLPKSRGYHTEPIIDFKDRRMVDLGDFTTNIVEAGKSSRFFKTKLSVRTQSAATSEEIRRKSVVIRDAVIKALGDKGFEEVATPSGKEKLKGEIHGAMNALLEEGRVEEVYFTQFIIQ